jgi:regulator of protease activity HflC (stomatin/prohibitin superfamily)
MASDTLEDQMDIPTIVFYALIGLGGIIGLIVLLGTFFTVEQQTAAIVARFGKFVRIAEAGLNFKVPLIEGVVKTVSYKVHQLDVKVETKTADNVFVHCMVSVQYNIIPEKTYDAVYKLRDPDSQITSYVFDTVRAQVPKITLDQVFENKDEIAKAVKSELTEVMDDFGYNIVKALITDIDPDTKVKESMNEINAAQRMRAAAAEKAEAQYVMKVKEAEAEAKAKELQGKGIANQRKAIVEGLKMSVDDFQKAVEGANAKDVMALVLMTQYFDTLKDIGATAKSNTIMMPHSPGALGDLSQQIMSAMVVSEKSKEE